MDLLHESKNNKTELASLMPFYEEKIVIYMKVKIKETNTKQQAQETSHPSLGSKKQKQSKNKKNKKTSLEKKEKINNNISPTASPQMKSTSWGTEFLDKNLLFPFDTFQGIQLEGQPPGGVGGIQSSFRVFLCLLFWIVSGCLPFLCHFKPFSEANGLSDKQSHKKHNKNTEKTP